MIFAKIDFINLLPFHIFIKKNIQSSQLKASIEYKKSYPSVITQKFKSRKVDSAFISSIASRNEKYLNFGIVAQDDVLSVLLIPGIEQSDYQSKTSNALAKVLDLKGKVIIGDKALNFYHENRDLEKIDLAKSEEDLFEYQGQEIVFSAKRPVDYVNENLDVVVYWDNNGALIPGTYEVYIFADGNQIGNAQFQIEESGLF